MIGKLTGTVDTIFTDHVLLDVQGVGYMVFCSAATLAQLELGSQVSLYTDMIVREDLLQLYGFQTQLEKDWHRLLMSVQGVGAKVALAIVGTLGVEKVERAIALEDTAAMRKAPGLGPKLAARIVRELASKVPDAPHRVVSTTQAPARDDALEALVNLGYQPVEARQALMQQDTGLEAAARIKGALKLLGQKAS